MDNCASQLDIPCLGRVFQVGALYDCCNESLVDGFNFYKLSELNDEIEDEEQCNISSEVHIESMTEDKILLNTLKAKASAGFSSNRTASKNEATVTFKVVCKTSYKRFNNSIAKSHFHRQAYKAAVQSGFNGATHIVVGVEYGCEAFFEFTQSVDERGKKHEILLEVVEIYKKLPSTERTPKPLSARIAPLSDIINFYGFEPKPEPSFITKFSPVSMDLVCDVLALFENLRKKTTKLRELASHNTCTRLEFLGKKIRDLKKDSAKHEEDFVHNMQTLIPKIRSSKFPETQEHLIAVLQEFEELFATVKADDIESKILELSWYLEKFDGMAKIKIVKKANVNTEIVASNHVLCFAFNDAVDLERDVSPKQLKDMFDLYFNFAMANFDPDCKSCKLKTPTKLEPKCEYCKFKTSYIVTERNFGSTTDDTGPKIILYKGAQPTAFIPPTRPMNIEVWDLLNNDAALHWLRPEFCTSEYILKYRVRYRNSTKKAIPYTTRYTSSPQPYDVIPNIFGRCRLFPNHDVEFLVQACGEIGFGPEEKLAIKVT